MMNLPLSDLGQNIVIVLAVVLALLLVLAVFLVLKLCGVKFTKENAKLIYSRAKTKDIEPSKQNDKPSTKNKSEKNQDKKSD